MALFTFRIRKKTLSYMKLEESEKSAFLKERHLILVICTVPLATRSKA